MDILYLLIPVTVLIAFGVLIVFAWSLKSGQFEDVEQEGARILVDEDHSLDPVQEAIDGDQGAP